MDLASANQTAEQFSKYYYGTFDTNRAGLANLYVDQSVMLFEGKQLIGKEQIIVHLQGLPFKVVQHVISTTDGLPTLDGGIMVSVMGQLKTDDDAPHGFSETFFLKKLIKIRIFFKNMGCIMSKNEETPPTQQVFSWDREDRPDPKDFTIENQSGMCCGRLPGTINGQQFIINNCSDCSIYLFDHSAMVTIDNCQNCRIFLGPIKGSVFIRNCKNIKCLVACQQFRARDCCKVDTFLLCATQPVIESSASMKFGCFQFSYPELVMQFQKASLTIYNNTWYSIHDFTPTGDGDNWSLIPESVSIENIIPRPDSTEFQDLDIAYDKLSSAVPLTRGTKRTNRFDESCLLVFFADTKSKCLSFLRKVATLTEYDIIQTKEINISVDEAHRIFKSRKYQSLIQQGSLVGLELNGDKIIKTCEETLEQHFGISLQNIFLSTNRSQGKADIDAFYNYVDMTMS